MKVLRASIAVLGLLIVVCAIAIASLVMLLDPNKLKSVIIAEVLKKSGYQLVIDGDLSWSFYPHMGIKIKHMTLRAPRQEQPFIVLDGINVATKLKEWWYGIKTLKGKVYVATATIANIKMEDLHVDLHWQEDTLALQAIKASLYAGSLEGSLQVQKITEVPKLSWDMQFDHVQIQPFLSDLNGADAKLSISGLGRGRWIAATEGVHKEDLLSHLDGTMEFKFSDGVVNGLNLNYLVQAADALVHKQSMPAPANLDQTAYDNLGGSALIKQGVMTTNSLILTAPAFVATGEGTIALNAKTIDLALQIKPVQITAAQPTSWAVPVLIQGDLSHPDVRLDMSDIRKLLFRQEIDNVKAKAREVIKSHIPGKTGSFLENLLS